MTAVNLASLRPLNAAPDGAVPRAVLTWRALRDFPWEDHQIKAFQEMPPDFPLRANFRAICNVGFVEAMVRLADGTMVYPPFQAARNLRAPDRHYHGPSAQGDDGEVIPDAHLWANFLQLRRQRHIVPVTSQKVLDVFFPNGVQRVATATTLTALRRRR